MFQTSTLYDRFKVWVHDIKNKSYNLQGSTMIGAIMLPLCIANIQVYLDKPFV